MTEKICTTCDRVLPLENFHVNSKGAQGRQAKCNTCTSAIHYAPNKEAALRRSKARRSTEQGLQKEREWANARRRSDPITRMLQEAKVRAKKRGFEFSITRDDVEMPDRCPVLGIEVGVQFGARADGSPSLDRIDTSRGYVPGNVKIISWRANRIKSDAHIDELRALVQYMEAGAITATKWEAA